MNTFVKVLRLLPAISLLISGCAALPVQTGQEESDIHETAIYQSILGKPLTNAIVSDFLARNTCSNIDQFLLCPTAGMALWTDSNQVVETVYLYLSNRDSFEPYQGQLPYGLKFYDNLEAVEYKLNRQGIGNAGLPDQEAIPDHMHYQAIYHQAGLTIIYDYPFADEDAPIYAIVVYN